MLANQLLSDWPIAQWQHRRLVVGVSGGADSVALLLALHELAGPDQLVVAHLNHGWRGHESDQDAAFVVELCQQLGHRCLTGLLQNRDNNFANQFDGIDCCEGAMLAKDEGAKLESDLNRESFMEYESGSGQCQRTEEHARRARYAFFKECAYEVGASYVVTAHTADDRIETLLHNMLRGSGLAGAASLVMFRSLDEDLVLVRPLLRKRRAEIEAFLNAGGHSFRQDSSNSETRYRRNFLRHQVLPLMAERYPALAANLQNFSELAEELLADVEQLADQWLEQVRVSHASSPSASYQARWPAQLFFVAPLPALKDTPWSVVQAALRRTWLERGWPQADMSRGHWQAVRELCQRGLGVVNLPGNLRAEVALGRLAIGRQSDRRPTED